RDAVHTSAEPLALLEVGGGPRSDLDALHRRARQAAAETHQRLLYGEAERCVEPHRPGVEGSLTQPDAARAPRPLQRGLHQGAADPVPLGRRVDRHDGDAADGIALVEEEQARRPLLTHRDQAVDGGEPDEERRYAARNVDGRKGGREAVVIGDALERVEDDAGAGLDVVRYGGAELDGHVSTLAPPDPTPRGRPAAPGRCRG